MRIVWQFASSTWRLNRPSLFPLFAQLCQTAKWGSDLDTDSVTIPESLAPVVNRYAGLQAPGLQYVRVRRPYVSLIWCGNDRVRKSGSNLDTKTTYRSCSMKC